MSRILGFVVGAVLVFGGLLYLLTPTGAGPAAFGLELSASSPGTADAKPVPAAAPAANDSIERLPVRQETSQPEPEPETEAEPEPDQTLLAGQAPAAAFPSLPSGMDTSGGQVPATAVATIPLPPGMDIGNEQALVEQALAVMGETQPAPAQREPGPSLPDPSPAEFTPASAAADDNTQWFAVWDPFHSELSANAFARRLERLTGLDYRVVRSGRAKYEVAVAFASEQERVANIALIEEATGLRIAGGDLLDEAAKGDL